MRLEDIYRSMHLTTPGGPASRLVGLPGLDSPLSLVHGASWVSDGMGQSARWTLLFRRRARIGAVIVRALATGNVKGAP